MHLFTGILHIFTKGIQQTKSAKATVASYDAHFFS